MSARSDRGRYAPVDSEQLDETFDVLWQNGERDALGGGIHESVLARRVDYDRKTVADYLDASDRYTRVDGISPDGEPRESFAYAEDVEA